MSRRFNEIVIDQSLAVMVIGRLKLTHNARLLTTRTSRVTTRVQCLD
jgi:hypothetical protein